LIIFHLSSIGDSIKGILEEEGIDSRGLFDDIKDVVKLAKDMGLDDNESFFSKVKISRLQISGGGSEWQARKYWRVRQIITFGAESANGFIF